MPDSPFDESDVVYVENHGTAPLDFRWGGRIVTVHPRASGGKGKSVQWPAVVNALGNPFATDHEDHNGSMIRDRAEEVGRLSVRYGLCNGSMYSSNVHEVTKDTDGPAGHEVQPYVKVDDGGTYAPHPRVAEKYTMRHPNLPRMHVYPDANAANDPETRDASRLFMVIDDPDGLGGKVDLANQGEVDTLQDQVANLTRMLVQVQNQLAAAADANAPTVTAPTPVAPVVPDVGQATQFIGGDTVEDEISAIEPTTTSPADPTLAVNPLDPTVAAAFGKVETGDQKPVPSTSGPRVAKARA